MVVTDEDEEGRRARASIRSCDQKLGDRHVRRLSPARSGFLLWVVVVAVRRRRCRTGRRRRMPRPTFSTTKKASVTSHTLVIGNEAGQLYISTLFPPTAALPIPSSLTIFLHTSRAPNLLLLCFADYSQPCPSLRRSVASGLHCPLAFLGSCSRHGIFSHSVQSQLFLFD